MGPHELLRAIVRSFLIVLAFSVLLAFIWSQSIAFGFAFGGIWSTVNFWTLKELIEAVVHRHLLRIILFSQLKLPILYGLGGYVLLTFHLSVPAAIVAFHIPFLMVGIESHYCQKREDIKSQETEFESNKEGRVDG